MRVPEHMRAIAAAAATSPLRSATRYAETVDGLKIAYQVVGDGPVDLVFVPWLFNHVETQWEDGDVAHFRNRLASFSRLIILDQRGTGLSDPVPINDLPTLELFMDDLRAVLDAAGSDRAYVVGHMDGGLISILFAATYPERVVGLVLLDAYARFTEDDGYFGWDSAEGIADTAAYAAAWGTGESVAFMAPAHAEDVEFKERLARMERLSASPGTTMATQLMINGSLDVRDVLPTVRVPTLVVHRDEMVYFPVSFGAYLAANIPEARLVVVPGRDSVYWGEGADATLDEVQEFVTGTRHDALIDRVLATVLFTDIVDSTKRAADVGDRRWAELLALHDEKTRRALQRFRGVEVKRTGDGFLATFDGPARAIRCAATIRDALRALDLDVRVGVHTGEVELRGDDIGGIGVHIAARVQALAGAGEIAVSSTVKDLVVGSGITFADYGVHALKGVPDEWHLFLVE